MQEHPYASIFPDMLPAEYDALSEDIAAFGLREAIWLFQGKVLDGRHRERACKERGVAPRYLEFKGDDGEAIRFVESMNRHRRHLTTSQAAACAVKAEKFCEDARQEAKKRLREAASEGGKTSKRGCQVGADKATQRIAQAYRGPMANDVIATAYGTNRSYVNQAAKLQKTAPDLLDKVHSGEVTIARATREAIRRDKSADLEVKSEAAKANHNGEHTWEIVTADCVTCLASRAEGTSRLVFADPPYNQGVDYGSHFSDSRHPNKFKSWCAEWIKGVHHVLTDDGSFFLLISHEVKGRPWDAELLLLAMATGFSFRQRITWYESFGVNCSAKYNRCSRAILWLTKHPSRFSWNPEPHGSFTGVRRLSDRQVKYDDRRADENGKYWDDVWGINPAIPRLVGTCKERIPDFPTQLPLDLLRPIVGCHSDPGDLVLDPFSGSGTTGCACIELGRRFVGIELSEKFADLSRKRLMIHSSKESSNGVATHSRTR